MMKPGLASCAAALTVALAVAACGSSSSSSSSSTSSGGSGGSSTSSAKGPINVLDITATSGPTAIYGEAETDGLEAAAAYYNAQGGILGHKVNIVVANDNSDPTIASSVATKDLSSDPGKYAMVWDGEEGTATAALIPIMKRYGVFQTAVNDGDNACEVGSACPDLFTQDGPIAAAESIDAAAMKKAGYTKIGIIADQATYDQSELAFMEPDLKKEGIQFQTATFPPTAVSLTPEMSQLKSDGVQAVFALALGPSAGYVLQARAALGWSIPLQFDITGSSTNVAGLVPKADLSNVKETIQSCEDVTRPDPTFSLMVKYAPQPLAGSVICPIAGDGWGGIVLLANAAEKAKSLSASALSEAAQNLRITSNEVSYSQKCWTPADHEDQCEGANTDYYEVVPVGQLEKTRLYPLGTGG
jgi:branched-chain amino acid transport system substrate-binding protein